MVTLDDIERGLRFRARVLLWAPILARPFGARTGSNALTIRPQPGSRPRPADRSQHATGPHPLPRGRWPEGRLHVLEHRCRTTSRLRRRRAPRWAAPRVRSPDRRRTPRCRRRRTYQSCHDVRESLMPLPPQLVDEVGQGGCVGVVKLVEAVRRFEQLRDPVQAVASAATDTTSPGPGRPSPTSTGPVRGVASRCFRGPATRRGGAVNWSGASSSPSSSGEICSLKGLSASFTDNGFGYAHDGPIGPDGHRLVGDVAEPPAQADGCRGRLARPGPTDEGHGPASRRVGHRPRVEHQQRLGLRFDRR